MNLTIVLLAGNGALLMSYAQFGSFGWLIGLVDVGVALILLTVRLEERLRRPPQIGGSS